ncbi:hypothetical protein [Brachybacterium sp. UNK5269]|uniref:hypothetical protein n=1 Tax=Brachybacterium sp. UNK5269 TaxID=3408576 RepID=UPI003BB209D6
MSDGGGEALFLQPLPATAVVAFLALIVTVFQAILSYVRQLRSERNGAVDAALISLLSPTVVEARLRVVQVARGDLILRHQSPIEDDPSAEKRSNDELLDVTDRMRAASLTLMWAVQAIEPRLKPVVRKYFVRSRQFPWVSRREELRAPSAGALHAQIEDFMHDLDRALRMSGDTFDWRREGGLTNDALDGLPAMRSGPFLLTSQNIQRLDTKFSGDEDSRLMAGFRKDNLAQDSERPAPHELRKAELDRGWAEHRAEFKPVVKPPRPVKDER